MVRGPLQRSLDKQRILPGHTDWRSAVEPGGRPKTVSMGRTGPSRLSCIASVATRFMSNGARSAGKADAALTSPRGMGVLAMQPTSTAQVSGQDDIHRREKNGPRMGADYRAEFAPPTGSCPCLKISGHRHCAEKASPHDTPWRQLWPPLSGFGMPSIGHSSVPTMGRVMASTALRVPSGSFTQRL